MTALEMLAAATARAEIELISGVLSDGGRTPAKLVAALRKAEKIHHGAQMIAKVLGDPAACGWYGDRAIELRSLAGRIEALAGDYPAPVDQGPGAPIGWSDGWPPGRRR